MSVKFRQLVEIWGKPNFSSELDLEMIIGSVCTDSRRLIPGDFFLPIVGDTYNGHLFLEFAYKSGAQATVISKKYQEHIPKGFPHWIVEDTVKAFQQIALIHRSNLNIQIIAITGSVGKTTTRELIRSSLMSLGEILATSQNHNNDIGVPMTLLQGKPIHVAGVIEMGMRGLGEIERLSFCSRPNVAVITKLGTAHLGLLGSRENIAKAKCEITTFLNPEGVVVIPAGDFLLEKTLAKYWNGRVIRVALNSDLFDKDLSGNRSLFPDLVGDPNFEQKIIKVDSETYQLPLEGKHNARNFLLALAVAKEYDVPLTKLKNLKVEIPRGRNNFIRINQINVIDETYNSSPESVEAALELLVSKKGRHFAVLGQMLELGEESIALHCEMVWKAEKFGLEGLIMILDGKESSSILNLPLRKLKKFKVVSTIEGASEILKTWLIAEDNLLLKGSRAVGLENLISLL